MANSINTAAQGEVYVRKVQSLPKGKMNPVGSERKFLIVGHSERGHHHGFHDDGSVEVLERTEKVPAGMKILYAIVKNPTALIQDAPNAHESIALDPGIYELRISREYNPFAEQARQVRD